MKPTIFLITNFFIRATKTVTDLFPFRLKTIERAEEEPSPLR